jgi:CheY-specific phosphatase CheX
MTASTFSSAFGVMQDYLITCTHELFESYGVAVTHLQDGSAVDLGEHPCVAAVLGYGGENLKGALVMVASQDVAASFMGEGASGELAGLQDVMGEFTNMLLGRVKNQFLRHSLVIWIATPTTLAGQNISMPPPKSGTSSWHAFVAERGRFYVRFDATFEKHFQLGELQPEPQVAAEGDLMMF